MTTETNSQINTSFSLGTFVLTEGKKLVQEMQAFSIHLPQQVQDALSEMQASTSCSEFESHWIPISNIVKTKGLPDHLLALFQQCAIVVDSFSVITHCLIGHLTMKHFKNLFPKCRIILGKKINGVMFGCTVLVLPNDDKEDVLPKLDFFGKCISDAWCNAACQKLLQEYTIQSSMPPCQAEPGEYFVKMHSKGHHIDVEFADSIADVDVTELICYKLLETMQLGPLVHFFSISDSFLLIATKHIQTRCSDGVIGKDFPLSSKGQHLQSLLSTNVAAFEQEAGALLANLTRIEVLCGVLGIGDVLTNYYNYFISPGTLEVALVDFRYTKIRRNFHWCIAIASAIITGKKYNVKHFANSIVQYTCFSKAEPLRIALAVQVLNDLESTLPPYFEKVLQELPQYDSVGRQYALLVQNIIREVRKMLLEYEPIYPRICSTV